MWNLSCPYGPVQSPLYILVSITFSLPTQHSHAVLPPKSTQQHRVVSCRNYQQQFQGHAARYWLLCCNHIEEGPDSIAQACAIHPQHTTYNPQGWPFTMHPEGEFFLYWSMEHTSAIALTAGKSSQDSAPAMWRALADDASEFCSSGGRFPAGEVQSQSSWHGKLWRGLGRKGGSPQDLWARRAACPLAPRERQRHSIFHSDIHDLIK